VPLTAQWAACPNPDARAAARQPTLARARAGIGRTSAPALVVEVVSKSDSANDVNEKVQDYLSGGAQHVWVIYPDQQAVHVHNADQPTRVVRGNESLTEEELLPGFALPLNLIFNDT